MAFQVYDFRKDISNILVTPQIRSRFLRMEIGQYNQSHTHDLGHEIFLILQGQAEFDIEGHKEVLGPGQMCIARTDEGHAVRNVGDEPVIMYLSVTPHIQPTHTMWNDKGAKEAPRFRPNSAYDVPMDRTTPTSELLDNHLAATQDFAAIVNESMQVQQEQANLFREALLAGDRQAALAARDAMWDALYGTYQSAFGLAEVWNAFTSRTADSDDSETD